MSTPPMGASEGVGGRRGFVPVVLVMLAASAPATTWDFETDFSAAANDNVNDVWSYRYQASGTRDDTYPLLPLPYTDGPYGSALHNGWRTTAADWFPVVGKNVGSGKDARFSPGIEAGQSSLHPSSTPGMAIVRWTAPATGWYDITYRFKDQNGGNGDGIIWYIDRNTTALATSTLANGRDTANAYVADRTLPKVSISAGDHINFIVHPNGNYFSDSTRLLARVETTTAPPVTGDYDLERDFDVGRNDNGIWSYRYQSNGSPNNRARDGAYELLPDANTYDPYCQGYMIPGGLPRIVKYFGSSTYTSGGYSVGAGETDIHPNPNQIVVAQWTAPNAGIYDIAYRVKDENTGGGDGIRWYIDKGSSSGLLAAGVVGDGGDTLDRTLYRVTVAAGEKVNFIVDPNGANHGWDSTRLKAVIGRSGPRTNDNLEADFQITPGMNTDITRWSYRYKTSTTRDGNYALMTAVDDTGVCPCWSTSGSAGKNYGNTATIGTQTYPPGAVVVHPPNDGQIVVVSWLAWDSCRVNINCQFTDQDPGGGNGVKWFVDQNPGFAPGSALASGTIVNGGDSGEQASSNITVKAGDRINFIVDPNGNYGYDLTRIRATVTRLDPPGTTLILR